MEKYFVDTMYSLSSELKNAKGSNLYDVVKAELEHKTIIDYKLQDVIARIETIIRRLDGVYPRMSKLSVRVGEAYGREGKIIVVEWVSKKQVKDICLKVSLVRIKEEIE